MFKNSYKIMFLLILMIGTLITISANTWISAWMGLEINLLSFIPLMKDDNNNLMSTEASLKYFLVQALASAILLFSIILYLLNYNLMIMNNEIYSMIILSSLLLKSGTAPFHFWFPNVMEGLPWMSGFILMTWQKLAPMMLMSYVFMKLMILPCILLSTIIGALGGLNQTSLKKLMSFSSINHIGWMLSAMYSSENLWMIYFLIYSFLNFALIFIFNTFNLFYINQLFSLFFNNKPLKFFMFMNLLSLGGLPPFLGFLPKWLVIQALTINNQVLLMSLLTVITLIALFFYIRLTYSAFMLNYYENNWNLSMQFNSTTMNFCFLLSFISIMGFILIWAFYFML
uniref:NADH dehydrogenase subunit 2 n=1 Tax=Chamaepsila testudinaria TaxID=2963718 RepID=UPI0021152EC5|nr:NADH dehydrogenase subunit 2 [Chamaepsila testudinaria]UTM10298.1 NADH dehydrogenase subunit 2 [Chamaepsila testudinaria]